MKTTLLPSGFMDILPPLAEAEFYSIRHFLRCFIGFGYQPVIPPLAEYVDTALAGQGEATGHHVLKLPDPLSPHILALRADMTGQIARIAGSALSQAPRPLRLSYAGYTLRAAPEALKTLRQHTQVGIERFGDISTNSTAEVLAITAHALTTAGIDSLTIDLHYPQVMKDLLAELPEERRAAVREAAKMKDTAQLRSLGAEMIARAIEVAGDAGSALSRLEALGHPTISRAVAEIRALTEALTAQKVSATLTVDMLDLSGYGYYCGIGYAIYWNSQRIEVGRGGCYETAHGEKAVGFTLYINELLERLPAPTALPVKVISYGTPAAEAEKIQADGFITVFGDKS